MVIKNFFTKNLVSINLISSWKIKSKQNTTIIIILCSIDSSNVNVPSTPLWEPGHRSLQSLQITITLTEGAWLIFFAIWGVAWVTGVWTHNLRSLFSVRCLWPFSHSDPNKLGLSSNQKAVDRDQWWWKSEDMRFLWLPQKSLYTWYMLILLSLINDSYIVKTIFNHSYYKMLKIEKNVDFFLMSSLTLSKKLIWFSQLWLNFKRNGTFSSLKC